MRYVLVVLLLSNSVQADLNKFAREYLGVATQVKNLSYAFEAQKISELVEKEKRDWNLSISETITDSELDPGPFSFQAPGQETKTTVLSVQKENLYGGQFNISGTLFEFDGSSRNGTPTNLKTYTQEMSYRQDLGSNFLGRLSKLQLSVQEKTTEYQKEILNSQKSKELVNFINAYLDFKRDVTLKKLAEEAYKRSQARLNLVGRQVRDGLKEKVDLLSTKNSHFAQDEARKNAFQQAFASKNLFEARLEKNVSEDEIETYEIKELKLPKYEIKDLENNHDIRSVDKKLDYLNDEIERTRKAIFPTIQLTATYETNNVETLDNPVPDGTFGSDNVNKQIGLNVVIPLGFTNERNALKAAKVNKMYADYEKKITKLQVEKKFSTLISQLKILDQNLKSIVSRYNLAKSSLAEYNRLYSRGRVSLDQVIRSEEDLINTEKSFVQYKVQREKAYYSLLDIYGELTKSFL